MAASERGDIRAPHGGLLGCNRSKAELRQIEQIRVDNGGCRVRKPNVPEVPP
jgi:hypothetical protein